MANFHPGYFAAVMATGIVSIASDLLGFAVLARALFCGHSQLVAFSCKGRGVCNSCAGRRMVDAAVHLEANVLPEVNIRHWVCTLPWGIRALLGYDKRLCAATLAAFVKECFRSLKRRAAEVADVALRTAQRLDKLLRAQGRSLLPDECTDPEPLALQLEHPALAACYDTASRGLAVSGDREGQPSLRLMHGQGSNAAPSRQDIPAAEVLGVNLYAKQVVDGRDRRQLERLCRYLLRPPIAEAPRRRAPLPLVGPLLDRSSSASCPSSR